MSEHPAVAQLRADIVRLAGRSDLALAARDAARERADTMERERDEARRERDGERRLANEWLVQQHDAERERDDRGRIINGIRDALDDGSTSDATIVERAARIRRERDEARGGTYRTQCAECGAEQWAASSSARLLCGACTQRMIERERDDARTEVATLRAALASTRAPVVHELTRLREQEHEREVARLRAEVARQAEYIDAIDRGFADMSDCAVEYERERDALREQIGFWERSSTARVLGVTPAQLATVRAVLAAAEAWEASEGWSPALPNTVTAWIAAGRPLSEEVSE